MVALDNDLCQTIESGDAERFAVLDFRMICPKIGGVAVAYSKNVAFSAQLEGQHRTGVGYYTPLTVLHFNGDYGDIAPVCVYRLTVGFQHNLIGGLSGGDGFRQEAFAVGTASGDHLAGLIYGFPFQMTIAGHLLSA